jgi:hypothetical protein
MPVPKIIGAQLDFSAGELDESMKRAGESQVQKAGARQMSNWRILSSKALQNRSGRAALFLAGGRTEEITMRGGTVFFINFSAGAISIFSYAGAPVFTATTIHRVPTDAGFPIPWTNASLGGIVIAQIGNTIYIAYPDGAPNNVPQVLSWDGVSTWMLIPYVESVDYSGQKRTPFYRISPPSITLLPSATTGNINITFSQAVLSAGMIGTRLEFCGRQLTITGVSSATTGTATVNEPLAPGENLNFTTLTGQINIGDVVIGSVTGATGIVTASSQTQVLLFDSPFGYITPAQVGQTITGTPSGSVGIVTGSSYYFDQSIFRIWLTVNITAGTGFTTADTVTGPLGAFMPALVTTQNSSAITVQLVPVGSSDNIVLFSGSETVVGPSGSFALTGHSITAPQAVATWDDEIMNAFRGYPSSVFADQSRLGFANFPAVPNGIAWSAISLPLDLLVGALPDNAIFELAPDNSQVFYVIPGMESSEFVFTDRAIYYIPIGGIVAKPLEPGSVAFIKLSEYGSFPLVQPRRAEQSIIYIKAGGTQVGAVQAPGAYYRPYVVEHISEMHTHLFVGQTPLAIAVPPGATQFSEIYLYVLMVSGALVVGRYVIRQGLLEPGPENKPNIGWLPWSGAGTVGWVSARQGDVIFTTTYGGASVVERLDDTQYLDGALLVNNLPAPFTPPGGMGPLFKFPGPNTTVFLIDLGTRIMDTYQVDANGFLVPKFTGGENLASPQLVAGQPWTATLELFAPEAGPGQSQQQRQRHRRISRMIVYTSNSSGYVMARLFAGPITPFSPALGTIMNTRRIATWDFGDNPTQPPPLREEAQRWRPIGRAYDPRVAVIKDTPGPILVHEVGIEVTI